MAGDFSCIDPPSKQSSNWSVVQSVSPPVHQSSNQSAVKPANRRIERSSNQSPHERLSTNMQTDLQLVVYCKICMRCFWKCKATSHRACRVQYRCG